MDSVGSMQPSGSVLITEASERAALAAIRDLGRAGLSVTAADSVPIATGFWSRWCGDHFTYPSPASHPEAWLECIVSKLKQHHYDMLVCIDDVAVLLCAQHRELIEAHTCFPFPDYNTLWLARDKGETFRIAQEAGIPCPRTLRVSDLASLKEMAEEAPYPCLIKPRESSGARGITRVDSPQELLRQYPRVHEQYPLPLIQEYIPTDEGQYDVGVLFDRQGEVCAIHQFQQLREYPLDGGPATLRMSIWDEEAKSLAVRLLKAMDWYGVALVEMKRDRRDGQLKLLEVNPRFWASLHLACVSGVPFPRMLYEVAISGTVRQKVLEHPAGRVCRSLLPGDIQHFFAKLCRGKMDWEFFSPRYWRVDHDVLSLRDPGPTLAFLTMTMCHLFRPASWSYIFGRGPRRRIGSQANSESRYLEVIDE